MKVLYEIIESLEGFVELRVVELSQVDGSGREGRGVDDKWLALADCEGVGLFRKH